MATARKVKRPDASTALTTDHKAELFFKYLCDREAEQTRRMFDPETPDHHYRLIKSDRAELRIIRDRFLEIFDR